MTLRQSYPWIAVMLAPFLMAPGGSFCPECEEGTPTCPTCVVVEDWSLTLAQGEVYVLDLTVDPGIHQFALQTGDASLSVGGAEGVVCGGNDTVQLCQVDLSEATELVIDVVAEQPVDTVLQRLSTP